MFGDAACIAEIRAVLRRHNRRGSDAEDRAYIDEVTGLLSAAADHRDLRGLANGTVPLDTPVVFAPPEMRYQDQDLDSPSPQTRSTSITALAALIGQHYRNLLRSTAHSSFAIALCATMGLAGNLYAIEGGKVVVTQSWCVAGGLNLIS